MSWRTLVILLVLAFGGFGCFNQHCTNTPERDYARSLCPLPHCGYDPTATVAPPLGDVPLPMTVLDTNRPARLISLREAIAIALERGTIGIQNAASPGFANDNLLGFQGSGVAGNDGIRVLALDPAISAANMEIALSRFDAIWNTSTSWNHVESPIGTNPNPFGFGGVAGPLGTITSNSIGVSTGLIKPLPTGGVAGITFKTDYFDSNPTSLRGQNYQPDLQLSFEQPLLQGFGVEINQLRETHPGSVLTPFATSGQTEGILITRLRLDQQRTDFERNVNYLLLNVEAAYWNLYGAYFQLYGREEAMRYAYEPWRLNQLKLKAGSVAQQQVAQARVQYERFRAQRLQALGQVLESERQLRGLLNLKIEDGQRLVPIDRPTLTPVRPDWNSALDDALAQRPELILARQELRVRQLNLIKERNRLLPDLRSFATTNLHSIGGHLDGGPNPGNAFHELVSDPFVNWSVGLRMNVPIGQRAANASVQAARLGVERSFLSLRNEEDKAQRFLGRAYRNVLEFHEQILVLQATFQAATLQLQKYTELFREGKIALVDANVILAQRDWSDSMTSLYSAIVQYNNALATLEFAKGTIMQHDGVAIADGPLPHCVEMRAVEHEQQRTRALVLKECDGHREGGPCPGSQDDTEPSLPDIPFDEALSVPAVQRRQLPVPELSDTRMNVALPNEKNRAALDRK